MILRLGLSPWWTDSPARLTVMIFHRVLAEPDPLLPGEPDTRLFREQISRVRAGSRILPLSEAVDRLADGRLPPRAVCITFDDGYRDNYESALPILQELGVPATCFVATGYLDGGIMFNDAVIEGVRRCAAPELDLREFGMDVYPMGGAEQKRAAIERILPQVKYRLQAERDRVTDGIAERVGGPPPDDLMMSSDQVKALHAAGVTIGGHTVTHPILATIGDDQARAEMADGKQWLEALIGAPVDLFAYPNGKFGKDYQPVHAQLAREVGFKAAVATDWGVADAHTDRYRLPRFCPWDRNPVKYALRFAANARHLQKSHPQ